MLFIMAVNGFSLTEMIIFEKSEHNQTAGNLRRYHFVASITERVLV